MRSFMELVQLHASIGEKFIRHQEALLDVDIPAARARLDAFEKALQQHMREEEHLLIPVYQRAEVPAGGSVEIILNEHRKILEALGQLRMRLSEVSEGSPGLKRRILGLLEEETRFKSLLEHHDDRERNLFYPTLDKVTTEEERKKLLGQCGGA